MKLSTILLGAGLALVACERPSPPAPQPPLVKVARPEVRDVRAEHVFIGRTESAQYVEVRARVEGSSDSPRSG